MQALKKDIDVGKFCFAEAAEGRITVEGENSVEDSIVPKIDSIVPKYRTELSSPTLELERDMPPFYLHIMNSISEPMNSSEVQELLLIIFTEVLDVQNKFLKVVEQATRARSDESKLVEQITQTNLKGVLSNVTPLLINTLARHISQMVLEHYEHTV